MTGLEPTHSMQMLPHRFLMLKSSFSGSEISFMNVEIFPTRPRGLGPAGYFERAVKRGPRTNADNASTTAPQPRAASCRGPRAQMSICFSFFLSFFLALFSLAVRNILLGEGKAALKALQHYCC